MMTSVASSWAMITMLLLQAPAVVAAPGDSPMLEQRVNKRGQQGQQGQDERRSLREQWEQASPEERIRMRTYFRDQMHQLSSVLPEPAQAGLSIPFGVPFAQSPAARPVQQTEAQPDSGFGFGFEKRRLEELSPLPFSSVPLWPGNQKSRGD